MYSGRAYSTNRRGFPLHTPHNNLRLTVTLLLLFLTFTIPLVSLALAQVQYVVYNAENATIPTGVTHLWGPTNGTIMVNATLDIEGTVIASAGTLIVVNNTYYIIVNGSTNGRLDVSGLSTNLVLFKANLTTTRWGGIFFNGTGASGTINYANVTQAQIGILINSSQINIYNTKLVDDTIGIEVYNSTNISIKNCTFRNNVNHGLVINGNSSSIYVLNCSSYENGVSGLFIDNSSLIDVANFTSYDNANGIVVNSTSNSTFINCTTVNSTFGLNVTEPYAKHNVFKWCVIKNSTHTGVYVSSVGENNTFFGCTVTNNTIGINVSSTTYTYVKYNWGNITENTNYSAYAIAITGGNLDFTYNWWGSTAGPPTTGINKVSGPIDYDPWLNASISAVTSYDVSAGTGTVSLSEANTYVTYSTTAPITIIIAKYTSNPGTTAIPSDLGTYIDVQISSAVGVDYILIKMYYSGVPASLEPWLRMFWWDGTAWRKCPGGVNTADNYIWTKITSATSPSLAQLTGACFGGGACSMSTGGYAVKPNNIQKAEMRVSLDVLYQFVFIISLVSAIAASITFIKRYEGKEGW